MFRIAWNYVGSVVLLSDADLLGSRAARVAWVCPGGELDALTLAQFVEGRTLHGAAMKEDVLATVVRCDKAEAFVGSDCLDRSLAQISVLS